MPRIPPPELPPPDYSGLRQEIEELRREFHEIRAEFAATLKPMETNALVTRRLLIAVVQSLDPEFLKQVGLFDEPEAEPLNGRAGDTVVSVPITKPGKMKLRVCVIGIRPDAEAQVRAVVNGQAEITCLLDDAKALKHGFKNYDGVVVTRHASHASYNRAVDHAGKDRVIRLRSTSADGVASAIGAIQKIRDDEARRRSERGR